MRRIPTITAVCLPLRKTAVGATAVRRAFPAGIDADPVLTFSVTKSPAISSRVRTAGLVLRVVALTEGKRFRATCAAPNRR